MKHVIIGNGPAGVVAAETLRKADPKAEVILIGDEPEPPYSRMAIPYLLMGNIAESGTHLRKEKGHFESLGIQLISGRVAGVDAKARKITLTDGKSQGFDRLLIASGSHPLKPPIAGMDAPNVHTCWTLEDARAIVKLAKSGSRVLQIGAGFIGCIIMEALAARGTQLTVVEMGDRMVPRMMTEKAGGMIRQWCEKQGVRVHTGAKVESLRAGAKAGELVAKLSNGQDIAADLVICAAGVAPNIDFLQGSGIAVERGILVDADMQSSVPGIYAAGDVTEAVDFISGKRTLNAIQPNAADQARIAAINMAGGQASLQGSLAINVLDTLGLISASFGQWWGEAGGESVERADENDFKYISLQFKDDVLIGATSIGLTDHVGVLRGLTMGRVRLGEWKERLLVDPTRIMEAYLARAQGGETRYLGTRPI
ncbi:MAG: NAD(P)/FAD-dependent oxidoreductase [Rhodocyclaceae bacterium]|nr:NAD(P)/FAD-dependent oxidoreductase [Rhodocyclaceae bacterium]MBZ0132952.1 FAD-dependent oxidoreductase [Rhodocyclaceae bacterium]MCW5594849.1 NAD(P)/FAD-dependent oxidoreductase [Rhodocyclaceae bacterium]PKO69539.1 MAG: FAD-dependent oxidoreductase [Betaproteobacteria bacterium HGW-Betaproteobacteria-14]